MASSDSKIRGRRRRLLVGSVTLGVAALGLSSCGFPASTASTDEPPSSNAVVECNSGTITQGDVQMSALVVERAPGGEHPDFPGGCVQTG
jgi:hypothetical protein